MSRCLRGFAVTRGLLSPPAREQIVVPNLELFLLSISHPHGDRCVFVLLVYVSDHSCHSFSLAGCEVRKETRGAGERGTHPGRRQGKRTRNS